MYNEEVKCIYSTSLKTCVVSFKSYGIPSKALHSHTFIISMLSYGHLNATYTEKSSKQATKFGNNYLNILWMKHVLKNSDFKVKITSDFYLENIKFCV